MVFSSTEPRVCSSTIPYFTHYYSCPGLFAVRCTPFQYHQPPSHLSVRPPSLFPSACSQAHVPRISAPAVPVCATPGPVLAVAPDVLRPPALPRALCAVSPRGPALAAMWAPATPRAARHRMPTACIVIRRLQPLRALTHPLLHTNVRCSLRPLGCACQLSHRHILTAASRPPRPPRYLIFAGEREGHVRRPFGRALDLLARAAPQPWRAPACSHMLPVRAQAHARPDPSRPRAISPRPGTGQPQHKCCMTSTRCARRRRQNRN